MLKIEARKDHHGQVAYIIKFSLYDNDNATELRIVPNDHADSALVSVSNKFKELIASAPIRDDNE